MSQDFTSLDVIRYLYKETDILNTLEIENAIENNRELREDYEDFAEIQSKLDACNIKIRPSIVKSLLGEIGTLN